MKDLAEKLRCMIGESVKVKDYPKAGSKVSGLSVDSNVPNTASISASLNDYTVLRGIRRVPMKDFGHTDPKKLFYAKDDMDRVRSLATEIKQNKRITPLIIVVDDEGIYVLEGAHRLGALHLIGAKELPALVVHDDEALGTNEAITNEEILNEKFVKMTADTFNAELFIGRWFMSKKPKDKKLYEMLAKKYPFKGRAWRLDESPYNKPYASWCGTLDGIMAWKDTMDPFGRTPPGWHVYSGQISKGIDLTKLVKDAKLTDLAAQRIMDVAEVVPIVPVKKMEPVYQ